MKFGKVSRRRFLAATIFSAPLLAVADAKWVEPTWVRVRRIRLGVNPPTHRLVHFTDLHYKGDRAYLASVVRKINAASPDFVCFTGDLIEDGEFLAEALGILAGIRAPLYGVPGNHDYWSKVTFAEIAKCFAATGGAWLLDQQVATKDGKFLITGLTCASLKHAPLPPDPTRRNLLLMHFPAWINKLGTSKFDLVLAGHSHGGQVRLPFYGAIYVPYGVDEYEMGLFHTPAGPLYVNPGIGWFPWSFRWNCRPEITVFEV